MIDKKKEDKFVNDIVKCATLTDSELVISNSDIQSAVEAFVMQNGGDEDLILERIRGAIEGQ